MSLAIFFNREMFFVLSACECLCVCFSLNVHIISFYIYNSLFYFLFYNVNVQDVCDFFPALSHQRNKINILILCMKNIWTF